ncbi:hypothetical protein CLV43_104423 [Umezawaea tangerina]|uniref:TAP-like protein n=1 Tax=Umezawaea tangerina TaxID=84725 RepID=A0A2T0TAB8_9PSEU|nr:hypothetical protein CLV43_104423 [Umezawaea tangerina]
MRSRPFEVRDDLPEITAPTLVVVGAHDSIRGPRWAEMLVTGIPHARALVLTDSGHFGHLEQPAEFASAVVDLVTKAAHQSGALFGARRTGPTSYPGAGTGSPASRRAVTRSSASPSTPARTRSTGIPRSCTR